MVACWKSECLPDAISLDRGFEVMAEAEGGHLSECSYAYFYHFASIQSLEIVK